MEKEKVTIFYSWQSDIKMNRYFIGEVLEKVVADLNQDETLHIESVVDRDTLNTPGSPNIGETILKKIKKADIFVADVTLVNKEIRQVNEKGRVTPNPNVILELGYAMAHIPLERIIMVMNTQFGIPDELPFDLKFKRASPFSLSKEMGKKDADRERDRFEKMMTVALRSCFSTITRSEIKPVSKVDGIIDAIDRNARNIPVLIKKYMKEEVVKAIISNIPALEKEKRELLDEYVYQGIYNLDSVLVDFCRLAKHIAEMDAEEAARTLYKCFNDILSLYTIPMPDNREIFSSFQLDVPKFIGHELFVMFFACLIREERWKLISSLLDQKLFARTRDYKDAEYTPFYILSQQVPSINKYRNDRLGKNRTSLHADLLNERHTTGVLAEYVPMQLFTETDFFLYLRAQLTDDDLYNDALWNARSGLYFKHLPNYIKMSEDVKYAELVYHALGLESFIAMRKRLPQMVKTFKRSLNNPFLTNAVEDYNFNKIGLNIGEL